ncbi:phosphoglycerate dehydrogenase [Desulfoluna spongiiphila]|nr:phosphoglycerate dehydrogenase [Desulfoluna spongiiphila]
MNREGTMPTILITTSSFGTHDTTPLDRLTRSGFEVVRNPFGRRLTEREVSVLIREHAPVGIVAGVEPLTGKVLEGAGGLKVISRCGIGLDSVALDTAARLGISVLTTPDAPVVPVAELTLGMMLSLLRGIHRVDSRIRCGGWDRHMGGLLSGKTVGIIGYGRVGACVQALLGPFRCRVMVSDPRCLSSLPHPCRQVPMDELLAASDIVTIHVPYTPETRHLINGEGLSAMKKGAFLINASRGGLVDEAALHHALESGTLGGAALDTFEEEPYKGVLIGLETVLLTAHIGSYAKEGRVMMEKEAVDGLLDLLGRT